MPLLRKPTTEELTDHFFGSGAFYFGWLDYIKYDENQPVNTFPVIVYETNDSGSHGVTIREEDFIEGIKWYAGSLESRTFDDLIEDMDADDVDTIVQYLLFGEVRYQ